ncbi:unnamed protein product [Paramecium pentaurelia]|uniref:Poly(A) RNA polymerase mitochondrial-like central palm domain-containing protein n=1 Tax=Paramecium pentaurelia TaxID=43138 RepID=A0A8S1XHG5_9CILI|nr:unnamed protein product [Paramecium pentaurelia]
MFNIQQPIEIESCLEQIFQKSLRDQQLEELINDSIQAFKIFLHNYELAQRNIKIIVFGSILNGFETKQSDIDFTITTNSYIPEVKALQYWTQQLEKQTRFKVEKSILNSRVPVIKLLDQQNLIYIDLCYNNLLGAINTRLLKAYSQLDEKVKKGWCFVKNMGKRGKDYIKFSFFIIFNYNTLVTFLTNKLWSAQFIGLGIQSQQYRFRNENIITIKTFFVYEGQTYEKLQLQFQQRISLISLQSLLQEFFYYYSQNGQGFNQDYKISINLKEKKDPGVQYSMSDPFDPLHDPLKKINKLFKNNKAFDNALLFLKTKQDTEYLFKNENQLSNY